MQLITQLIYPVRALAQEVFAYSGRATASLGPRPPHCWGFTLGRAPLVEWSARRRDLYLTTHNFHKRQPSMPPAGFEPEIPAKDPRPRPLGHRDRRLREKCAADVRFPSKVRKRGIFWWKKRHWDRFFSKYFVFPWQFYFTSALYSYNWRYMYCI
jgi:hypothetical protein